MKKLLVCFAVLALLLVPAMAMAYNDGQDLPPGATEVEHWEWDGSGWVRKAEGDLTALARCWRSGPANDKCNKEVWTIDFVHHASMAQWCEWSIGGTRWDWRILKPGTYAADCIEFTVKSNNDVVIGFAGFADLEYTETGGVNRFIETYYSYGETIEAADINGWTRASDLNEAPRTVSDSADIHAGVSTKLFNKIIVENCNSSCEYENQGQITITLQNIKRWVDPVTGTWFPPPSVQ
jgi:hypothetical protein